MAFFQTTIITDLARPLETKHLGNALFTDDVGANRIIVELYENGVAKNISANTNQIKGKIIKSDGTTLEINGGVTGTNKAYIDLPANAYNVAGPCKITIRVIDTSVSPNKKTVIGACYAYIQEG